VGVAYFGFIARPSGLPSPKELPAMNLFSPQLKADLIGLQSDIEQLLVGLVEQLDARIEADKKSSILQELAASKCRLEKFGISAN
jgi:hypothetical protein